MKVVNDFVEGSASLFGSIFKTSMTDFCDIETADSDTALVTSSGTLVSAIRLNGIKSAVGSVEFEETCQAVIRALETSLNHEGHSIEIFFSRDPESGKRLLRETLDGSRKACSRLGLNVGDVLDSNERVLGQYTAGESAYLSLWTRNSLLSGRELKDGLKARAKVTADYPKSKTAQNPFASLPQIRERHDATISEILKKFDNAGIWCQLLTAHEMLREARMNIDPDFTPTNWSPALIGDPLPIVKGLAMGRGNTMPQFDFADIQSPPVQWQMFPREATKVGTRYVVIGDRAYAPVFIEVPPREVGPFTGLNEALISAKVPYRILFKLDGGGMKYLKWKIAFSTFTNVFGTYNRRISAALKDLESDDFASETILRVRIALCTWAPANDLEELARRASRMAQAVASWGNCEVREVSGDPMAGFMSSVPFMKEDICANPGFGPLVHVVRMLPLMRPASPWTTGSMLYRTRDGKLMPFQPGSKLQTTWIYILFGLPGKGKSFQMNSLLLAACMEPSNAELPRIGIVDIGPSSQYFVEMVRDSLPESERHKVAAFRLRMSEEYAINPFDTPLGCRFPTPEHKAFLVNIVTQVATPAEIANPYTRMSELVSGAINEVYVRYADEGNRSDPKRYAQGVVPSVDTALDRYGFVLSKDTKWWQVVDFLYSKGDIHQATLAQRYAVPTLADLASLSKTLQDMFSSMRVDSGETLPEAFQSLLSSAQKDYPNLAYQTRFDIGDARVVAINLEDVAKGDSAAGRRQAAIMYMLASYALTKDYRINPEVVNSMRMPEMYREFHLARAESIRRDVKYIAYDEFHRTSKSPQVQESVLLDMREGRKFNVCVIVSSQSPDDFPATMKDFATGIFICDSGTENSRRKLQEYFGFNDTAKAMLQQYVMKPGREGAAFLGQFDTSVGKVTQLLYSTLGPETLWALNTTSEDVLVREIVCKRLGSINGRRALATFKPGGAKDDVERLKNAGDTDAVRSVANEIIAEFEKARARK